MRSARRRVLVVRSDNEGDVLLAGPAIRAVAAQASVTLLCGPRGRQAASLLPGVSRIICRRLPWIDPAPPAVSWPWTAGLVDDLRSLECREAVILTSFHQSALPLALLLRAAGVQRITAVSEDYPGSLIDVRLPHRDHEHEVHRGLRTVEAAGFPLPSGDDDRLAISVTPSERGRAGGPVVVHPGASASTRGIPAELARETVRLLAARGTDVIVTGGVHERQLTSYVAAGVAEDLGGKTADLGHLARVLSGATALIVGNTGAAHLGAAVGTPVVSVFAPVVDWHVWRPHGVPVTRFGDQVAACAGTRARTCPVPGHLCVSALNPSDLADAALAHMEGERGWTIAHSMS
jgi:ADP-heptose:LPS heptosyltransferase